MKKLNLTYAFVALIILCTTACKKLRNDDKLVTSAKEFVATNGPQTQKIIIKGNVANTFTLKGGTIITIPAGAIKVGGVAANGDVSIEAMEFLKRSEVIFGGANTNHISGAPLESDGFIYLNAKINGVNADQVLGAAINISIPANRTGTTKIWEGVDNVGGGNQFAWQALSGVNVVFEVNAFDGKFSFNMSKLGWANCDIFLGLSNPKTTTRVTLVNNPGTMASFRALSGETFVFFCAKGSNVAAQIYTADGANKVKSYDNMMPIGIQGKYISFSIKGGKFYYAEQETTIITNQSITLNLVETTEAQVQTAINSLNNY